MTRFFVSSLIWRFARVRAKNFDCVVSRFLLLLLVVVVGLAVVFPDAEGMNARCLGEDGEDEGDTPHRGVWRRSPDRRRCCRRRHRFVSLDVPRAGASGFFFFGFANDDKEFVRVRRGHGNVFSQRYSFLIRTFKEGRLALTSLWRPHPSFRNVCSPRITPRIIRGFPLSLVSSEPLPTRCRLVPLLFWDTLFFCAFL